MSTTGYVHGSRIESLAITLLCRYSFRKQPETIAQQPALVHLCNQIAHLLTALDVAGANTDLGGLPPFIMLN